jgi:predicted HicB family RNase H-like nuclease
MVRCQAGIELVLVTNEERMTLRLPKDVHAALKRIAEREGRSLHNLLIYWIRRAIEQESGK